MVIVLKFYKLTMRVKSPASSFVVMSELLSIASHSKSRVHSILYWIRAPIGQPRVKAHVVWA